MEYEFEEHADIVTLAFPENHRMTRPFLATAGIKMFGKVSLGLRMLWIDGILQAYAYGCRIIGVNCYCA